jgi:hypothetical protein
MGVRRRVLDRNALTNNVCSYIAGRYAKEILTCHRQRGLERRPKGYWCIPSKLTVSHLLCFLVGAVCPDDISKKSHMLERQPIAENALRLAEG